MTPFQSSHSPTVPTIQTRHELDAVVENIVQLQLNRADLERAQDQEITAVRQKYRTPLAEIERYLTLETTWAEAWARKHPGVFAEKRSLECTHASIGFRVTPPRIERASRKWTWSEIALKLGEFAWGRRYLRTPALEVNKEALLADRAELEATELRKVGVKIVQEERFFVTPHTTLDYSHPAASCMDPDWQEAA